MQNNIIMFDIVVNNSPKTTKGFLGKFFDAIKARIPKRNASRVAGNIVRMINSLPEEQQYKSAFRISDSDLSFELVSSARREYYNSNTKFDLMSDFDKLVEFVCNLYSEPERKEKVIEITIEMPKPRPQKLVKTTTYEKVTILDRWVKIGYKMYRRQFDFISGREFIVVDGQTYWLRMASNGQEYLAE